jgi:hypothetical protein
MIMAYVALKPCSFAGQRFRIGETVPAEVIQPGAARNLVKMGLIADDGAATTMAAAAPAAPAKDTVTITVHAKEGDMPLEPTTAGLQAIFDVLTANIADAEPTINEMTDGDALILLDFVDNRKSIKDIARTRAKELYGNTEESAGED